MTQTDKNSVAEATQGQETYLLAYKGPPGGRSPLDPQEKPFRPDPKDTATTGACPDCREVDATLATANGSWHVCHRHKKKWQTDPRSRGGTGDHDENAAVLAEYEEVEPYWPEIVRFGLEFWNVPPAQEGIAVPACLTCSSPLREGYFARVFATRLPDAPLCMDCARQCAPDLAALSDLACAAQELCLAGGAPMHGSGPKDQL